MISIDFSKLDSRVKRIVFVLSIYEALEKQLDFTMLKDIYIRIMDKNDTELVSFMVEESGTNMASMLIGEIYQYKDKWKFSAVGSGFVKDLAVVGEWYGVKDKSFISTIMTQ